MKALILEPNKLFQRILVQHFNELGSQSEVVNTGKDGKAALKRERFDLICLSLHLEDMSGIEFVRQARDLFPRSIPVLLLTSEEDKQVHQQGLEEGVTEIFQKSRLPELLAYLKNFASQADIANRLSGRVLLVEDDKSIALVLAAMLQELGLVATRTETAENALNLLDEEDYDLIITDFLLEGQLSGLGLVRQVRGRKNSTAKLPILAMSAMDDVTRRVELLRAGATDYLSKPILQEELQARVRNLVLNKQLFDQVQEQSRRLEELALTDQLTGLYNRHSLLDLATKYISEAYRHQFPLSMVVVDIDHFKAVNDTYGHTTGDEVLCEVAELFTDECRGEDFVARFGGEEFVIMLTHCDRASAVAKAETLRAKLEALKPTGLHITASFGVAGLPQDNRSSFEELFNDADEAVYKAKQAGRNRVCTMDD